MCQHPELLLNENITLKLFELENTIGPWSRISKGNMLTEEQSIRFATGEDSNDTLMKLCLCFI